MLAQDLKVLLATEYAFAIKCQFFHWCVEGPDFGQLHAFFAMIYDDVNDNAIDQTAEYIRSLDEYTPGSFERFQELSLVKGQIKVPRARLMLEELLADNQVLIDLLNTTFKSSQAEAQEGIANFIAERIDQHSKWAWQIRSFLKDQRA